MKDYYQILNIPRTASADEIKRAYRRLASQHHPDKGGDTARFQEVEEAYRVLGDANRRQEYDNPRPTFNFNRGAPGFNLDEIFNMFGADFRHDNRSGPVARLSLWVDLEDVVRGGPRSVALQVGNRVTSVEINIPPGIEDGDSIRYPGLSPNGSDLVIHYRIKPNPRFEKDNRNLICQHEISIWDLVLGCEITVIDAVGTTLALTVPPGTQPNSLLRIRGRGIPASTLPGRTPNLAPGDLMVRMVARIPNNIDPEIIEVIRRKKGH